VRVEAEVHADHFPLLAALVPPRGSRAPVMPRVQERYCQQVLSFWDGAFLVVNGLGKTELSLELHQEVPLARLGELAAEDWVTEVSVASLSQGPGILGFEYKDDFVELALASLETTTDLSVAVATHGYSEKDVRLEVLVWPSRAETEFTYVYADGSSVEGSQEVVSRSADTKWPAKEVIPATPFDPERTRAMLLPARAAPLSPPGTSTGPEEGSR
jgi:hypothetical protein